ncbi:MAG: nucleotide exchange factor GrpE [Methanosarcinales archaeon]|nr:nucleotide exchange factor GrpE [Methanosarcinales archaeon]
MGKNEDTEIESSNSENPEMDKEIEATKKRADEYLDSLQHLQAEFDNYKKRVDKEKKDLIEYANSDLISELIDVMENLERGVASARDSDDIESVVKGMEMVCTLLKGILESKGLRPIEAAGQKFDPYYHEAMMKTPSDEYPNNTVMEEFQRGYKIKDRVIRYSKVSVSVDENKNNNTNA